MTHRTISLLVSSLLAGIGTSGLQAQSSEKVVNLYSARHYKTDKELYSAFTRQTGIEVRLIEGKEDELLERIKKENEAVQSPADIFITTDASRLAKADELNLFAPVASKVLENRIPSNLRSNDWFAFSTRGRVILYNKKEVNPADVQTYADLALPKMKGKVCTRSGAHPYNLSLLASIISHEGEKKAEEWARGMVANFARSPKGGDTDQIKSVAAGECGVTISNTYYIARLMRSENPEDKKIMDQVGVVWPNQKTTGTHINISGGGVLKTAPHKENAIKFLEYLASDSAQRYFADGNNEWPAVSGVSVKNEALESMGKFKADPLNIGELAKHQATAQKIMDRVGYK